MSYQLGLKLELIYWISSIALFLNTTYFILIKDKGKNKARIRVDVHFLIFIAHISWLDNTCSSALQAINMEQRPKPFM